MDVFGFRDQLISAYAEYITSFIQIRDPLIKQHVDERLGAGQLWPEPLIQLNPSFEPGSRIETLVDEGVLHEECRRIFRKDKDQAEGGIGRELRLHKHQEDAIRTAQGLRFLVLDELHTYRGRQGADVALLVRRVRDALNADHLQCVGTSATLVGTGGFDEQRRQVANVAGMLFGAEVRPEHVIGETLRRRANSARG